MRLERPLLSALAVALLVPAARADTETTLTWEAPPDCPDSTAVRAAFNRMRVRERGRDATATATVTRNGTAYALELSLRSATGSTEIRLEAPSCATLADVVALELALSSDAGVATSAVKSRTEPVPQPASPAPSFAVAIDGGVLVGPLPGVSPGVRAIATHAWPRVGVELGAKYFPARSVLYEGIPDRVGAELDLFALSARLCSLQPGTGFGITVCGGFDGGVLRGTGVRVEERFTSSQFYGAVTASPGLVYRFTPEVAIHAEAEFGLLLGRPEFHARNLPTLFRAERTASALWAGAEVRF